MIIFGITGTIGSGKGTIVDFLVNNKQFVHYSVRSFLIEELKRRLLDVNRDTLTELANELREKHNPAYIIECLAEKAHAANKNCVIESIRTPGEIAYLKKFSNFYLLSVDADPQIRYQRITVRKSETDSVSYETFLENEHREMRSSDPNKQNLSKCIELADFKLMNNADMEALYSQLNVFLEQLKL